MQTTDVGCHAISGQNRLIGIDPTVGVRVPGRRVRDTDERIVTREDVRQRLVPAVQPIRYRTFVATAAFTGLRWGEAIGLCRDVVDLDGRTARVIRTVTEVAGQTEFKAFPKSRAGRRTVPLPDWLIDELRTYMELYPPDGPQGVDLHERGRWRTSADIVPVACVASGSRTGGVAWAGA